MTMDLSNIDPAVIAALRALLNGVSAPAPATNPAPVPAPIATNSAPIPAPVAAIAANVTKGKRGRKPDPADVRLAKALAKAGFTPAEAKAMLNGAAAPAPAQRAAAPAAAASNGGGGFNPPPKAPAAAASNGGGFTPRPAKAKAKAPAPPEPTSQWQRQAFDWLCANPRKALQTTAMIREFATQAVQGVGPLADKAHWKGADGPLPIMGFKLTNAAAAWRRNGDSVLSRFPQWQTDSLRVCQYNLDWLEGPLNGPFMQIAQG
jgi:hypothetical protein